MWSNGTFRLILMIFAVAASVAVTYADTRVLGWGNLLDVAVSPAGNLAAAAGADGTIVLFSPAGDGWEVFHIAYSTPCSPPISLLFSPDGRVLYVIHDDGFLRLWDPRNGTLIEYIAVFEKGRGSGGLDLSPAGEFIAVGSLNAGVRVVQASTGQIAYSTPQGTTGIAIAFISEDELAIGSVYGEVYLWRLGDELQKIYSHRDFVNRVLYYDGHLISVSDDKTAVVYDLKVGKVAAEFRLPNFIRAVALHPNGRWILLGSYREAVVWDYVDNRVVARIEVEGWVSGIACHPYTEEALLVTWEGKILVWDIESGALFSVPKPDLGEVEAVSPDCSLLITKRDTHARIYSFPAVKPHGEIPLGTQVRDVAWVPGQDAFVTLTGKGLKLWDARTLELQSEFAGPPAGDGLSLSRDGRFIAVEGWNRAWICDVEALACREIPLPGEGHCRGVAVSPGGRQVAVLFALDRKAPEGNEEKLLVWDAVSGEVSSYPAKGFDWVFFWDGNVVLVKPNLLRILYHSGSIRDIEVPFGWAPVCFLRDDGVLACGDSDGKITIVDLDKPASPYEVKLYEGWVRSIFLCDRFALISTEGGTVVVHELPREFVRKGDSP